VYEAAPEESRLERLFLDAPPPGAAPSAAPAPSAPPDTPNRFAPPGTSA